MDRLRLPASRGIGVTSHSLALEIPPSNVCRTCPTPLVALQLIAGSGGPCTGYLGTTKEAIRPESADVSMVSDRVVMSSCT